VSGFSECGDEPSGCGATDLLHLVKTFPLNAKKFEGDLATP
jgi:hypothetical protein